MEITEFLTLLFLLITALATSIYAWLFWRSLEPLISIGVEFDKNNNLTMNLVIENAGNGPAYNVNFEILPDFEIIEGRYLSQIGLMKKGLIFFPPHQKIMTYLAWLPAHYKKMINTPLKIIVTYKRHEWSVNKITKEFIIDFTFFGEVPLPPSPLSEIATSLEKIERKMDRFFGSDFQKIKVVAYTKDENDQEIEQKLKELRENKE